MRTSPPHLHGVSSAREARGARRNSRLMRCSTPFLLRDVQIVIGLGWFPSQNIPRPPREELTARSATSYLYRKGRAGHQQNQGCPVEGLPCGHIPLIRPNVPPQRPRNYTRDSAAGRLRKINPFAGLSCRPLNCIQVDKSQPTPTA